MLNPVQKYSISFTSDGIATVLAFDASVAPISQDFTGNLPSAVLLPAITATGGAEIPDYVVALTGTTITVTFASAPPQLDVNSQLVIYTLTFYLQYPN